MTPIDIAKRALERIIREGDVGVAMIAVNALTDIAIEEQMHPPPSTPTTPSLIKSLFGGKHGS